jgi:mono/diheme cytochrome c family protein
MIMRKGLIFIWPIVFLLVVGLIIQTVYGQEQKKKANHYTSAQVARGEYLVLSASLCITCHTILLPDKLLDTNKLFAGGFQFIPEKLWSSNITMDKETGLGKWTDKQIIKAIKEGIDDEGKPLLPIMPYYIYANMSDEDALAIVAYLRTKVKPVHNEVPERAESVIPANPLPPLDYAKLPGTGNGKYFVTAVARCTVCHTMRIEDPDKPGMFQFDLKKFLAGGRTFNPAGYRSFSANITPDIKTGIAEWTEEQLKAAIRDGKDIGGEPLCPPMPKYANLTDKDLNDIVKYLKNIPAIENMVPECQKLDKPTQQ